MKKGILLCLMFVLLGCTVQKTETIQPVHDSIVYEIYVGSFYDSDGDGMGDLNGITQKLDYIRDLGATSIWLMPIHPSPTYHKYDVTDYTNIDSNYGTLEDFDALISAMNERGMHLIMDLVLNHSSAQHPWFVEAKKAWLDGTCDTVKVCDYYHFSDVSQPGFTKINDSLYYESVFWDQMPDLNLQNSEVRNEFDQIIKFWMDRGVTGFRLDATTHFERENVEANIEVLSWINETVKAINPEGYIVGEAWTSNSIVEKMYASNVDSFFNFGLSQQDGSIVKLINSSWGHDLAKIKANHDASIKEFNPDAVDAIFLSNHDNNRSAGYLSMDIEKQKLAASVYMMMPGNVFIYYGEEIGMLGSGKDENKRLAIPWSEDGKGVAKDPTGADYKNDQPNTVASSLKDSNSLLNFYKKLGQIRNTYPSISRSMIQAVDTGNRNLYMMEHEEVYILHNFSKETQSFETKIDFSDIVIINGATTHKSGVIEITGYGSAVLIK